MDTLQMAILRGRAEQQNPSPSRVTVLPGVAPWRAQWRGRCVIAPGPRLISVGEIITHIAAEFDMTPEQIRGNYRKRKFAYARHVAQFLATRLTQQSLPTIGRVFYRDHSSILHGCRRIKGMMENNPRIRARVERLERELRAVVAGKVV